ncbi:MAG: NAD(P)/FAD-dependent oxidoreductase [Ignavibacteriae bacterium]|nr:NAD(P)/FAD-dependent oxidoreductase [Ignavibacteria bacterium]MBI3363320.1 NAD(P)/FAD-dependent oxidoreductase [Ignavibacteriota bacterium]
MRYDVVIVGAGAAGLLCAAEAGKRGRRVVVLEHNERIGEKIRISGGGRCNFTNISADYSNFLSENHHFCRSAFARYTPQDFVALVENHRISYHEKKLGQLFCDESSHEIIAMLQEECDAAGVDIRVGCTVHDIEKRLSFVTKTDQGDVESESLVIATGGLSIPPLGATDFGYRIAKKFGLNVIDVKPGLVPFTWSADDVKEFSKLRGVSIDVSVHSNGAGFRENILFTHRGVSGPAILQISSYWKEGNQITINLLPERNLEEILTQHHETNLTIGTALNRYLPKRFVQKWVERHGLTRPICQYSSKDLKRISDQFHQWVIVPEGTEGYAKAEVTVGGIDTNELSSKTMEAKKVPGLYFIGEVVDVTGWLGGYNFQWAWSSGWVAGQFA